MTTTAEYGLGPLIFPRGWFVVATVDAVTTVPSPARFFGRDFVLYRGEGGRPVMLDAYCPHMGSHLASGQMSKAISQSAAVQGDVIRCPLHGWRFGADGRCVEIPYSPKIPIPAAARLRSYPLREHAGFLLVWHDEEEGEPDYEPAPVPEWDDPNWLCGGITNMGVLTTHQAEVHDHHVDKIHNVTVHGHDDILDWVTTFDGVRVSQRGVWTQAVAGGGRADVVSTSERRSGMSITRIDGPLRLTSFSAGTPVEDGTVNFWHGFFIQSGAGGPEITPALMEVIQKATELAYFEDMDILQKKLPAINPMQIPGDGPFRKMRTWYSQFYNPRSKAAAIQAQINGDHVTEGAYRGPWAA